MIRSLRFFESSTFTLYPEESTVRPTQTPALSILAEKEPDMKQEQMVAPPATASPPAPVSWSRFTAHYCQMCRYFKQPIHYTGLAEAIRKVYGPPWSESFRIAQLHCAAWLKLEEMNDRARYRMGG